MTAAPSVLLVARAQTGDRRALDRVLAAIQEPLLGHIRAIVGDGDEALDVLQVVLLTIARKLPSLREPRLFRAWAYRIATREAMRRHRTGGPWREARRDEFLAQLPAAAEDEPPFDQELLDAVRRHVEELPPASRLAVRMHYLDGLSYDEVSEALDVPLGTLKSRLAYARDLLRQKLVLLVALLALP